MTPQEKAKDLIEKAKKQVRINIKNMQERITLGLNTI